MILKQGGDIRLGGITYSDLAPLGTGAVAEAYAATAFDQRVVVKLLGEKWSSDGEEAQGLAHEAEVLRTLNAAEDSTYADLSSVADRIARARETEMQRVIVALFDAGFDDIGRPYVVQELAPPSVEIRPVTMPEDEWRILLVLRRVAQGLVVAHRHGFALTDFEPAKYDRIRVRWREGTAEPQVCLIDWNITGGPDQFERDIFYFGGHTYHLLLGRYLEMESDGRPPHTLGLGAPAWNALSEGSRILLNKLLHRDPLRRYRQARDLEQDLTWLLRTIEWSLAPSQIDRLRTRAYDARGQERYDRLLALTELALRLPLSGTDRALFETLRNQAREELEKELWQPIAMAHVSLLAKQYNQAAVNFERALVSLDARSEPARRARYLRQQALVGQALRDQGAPDPTQLAEWEHINRGVQQLIDHTWEDAVSSFGRAATIRPALTTLPGFANLRAIAGGGAMLDEAARLQTQAQSPGNPADPEWLKKEQDQINKLKEVRNLLDTAVKGAPSEPFLDDALRSCRRELEEREKWWDLLRQAETALADRNDAEAANLLKSVLADAPRQQRALFLLPKAESLQKSRELLAQGYYVDALQTQEEAQRLFAGDARVEAARTYAAAGAPIERKVGEEIDRVADVVGIDIRLAMRDHKVLQERITFSLGKLSADFGTAELLPDSLQSEPFILSPNLEQRLGRVAAEIEKKRSGQFREIQDQVEKRWEEATDWQASDFIDLEKSLDKGQTLAVTESERAWLTHQSDKIDRGKKEYAGIDSELKSMTATTTDGPGQKLEQCIGMLRRIDADCFPALLRKESRRLLDEVEASRHTHGRPPQPPDNRKSPLLAGIYARLVETLIDLAYQAGDYRGIAAISGAAGDVIGAGRVQKTAFARAALQGQDQARELLTTASTPADLEEALRFLRPEDESEAAGAIRRDIGGHWRRLARSYDLSGKGADGIQETRTLARQGVSLLRPYGLAEALAGDVSLLDRAAAIQAAASGGWAYGIEESPDQFAVVGTQLQELRSVPEWPALTAWAEEAERSAAGALKQRLDETLADVDQSPAEDALARLRRGQELLAHPLWARLLADFSARFETAISRIETATSNRTEAASRLNRVVEALKSENLRWGTTDAQSAIDALSEDYLSDDGKRMVAALRTLQTVATALRQRPDESTDYATVIAAQRRVAGLAKVEGLRDAWLAEQQALWFRECNQNLDNLVNELGEVLKQETEALLRHPEPDTGRLGDLYWQAQLIMSGQEYSPLMEPVAHVEQGVVRLLQDRLNAQLRGRPWPPLPGSVGRETPPDLAACQRSLDTAQKLMEKLSAPPSDERFAEVRRKARTRRTMWPHMDVLRSLRDALAKMEQHQSAQDFSKIQSYLDAYTQSLGQLQRLLASIKVDEPDSPTPTQDAENEESAPNDSGIS